MGLLRLSRSILGMVGGAAMGLVVGSGVHADVAARKTAAARNDVPGYNHAVDRFNSDVQMRGYAFGAVNLGALFMAATAGYDIIERRRASA